MQKNWARGSRVLYISGKERTKQGSQKKKLSEDNSEGRKKPSKIS
jgi:hypothetical protein